MYEFQDPNLDSTEAQQFAEFVMGHAITESTDEQKKFSPEEAALRVGRYTLANTNGEEPFLVEFQYHPGEVNNPSFPEPNYFMEIKGVLRDENGKIVFGNPNQRFYTIERCKAPDNEDGGFMMASSASEDFPVPVTIEKRMPQILGALTKAEDDGRLVEGYDDSEEKQKIEDLHRQMKAKHSWW